jgi:hypothetical protein
VIIDERSLKPALQRGYNWPMLVALTPLEELNIEIWMVEIKADEQA